MFTNLNILSALKLMIIKEIQDIYSKMWSKQKVYKIVNVADYIFIEET